MPRRRRQSPAEVDVESLYLERLSFDEKMRGHWVEVLFRNVRLLILAAIGIIVFGLFSFFRLPRELNPDVVIPAVTVVTTLPGASPRDVETLVTEKLEKASSNLPNIDLVQSQSTAGVSVITFQFLSSQDLDEALRKTSEEITSLRDELPDTATQPRVEKININDQPFLVVALSSDHNRLTSSRIARELKDSLENVSGIRKVELTGLEEDEIVVELKPQALTQYQISEATILQALKANDVKFPSGDVTVGNFTYAISLDNKIESVEELSQLPIRVGTQVVPLSQLATVQIRTKELSRLTSLRVKGETRKDSVQVSIFKSEGETITGAEQKTRQVLKEYTTKYPQIEILDVQNFAKDISTTFSDLQENFLSSVALIFVVLAFFLGVRQATVAALSIPLVIMCTFVAMSVMGLTLNFLSLFSLLLALSLIGDDAIVMAQATTAYGRKFGPIETGLMVFRDYFIPIWVGTITVVWSFLPLLLASGIIGAFIKPIPLVVTATLLSSTAIATLLNLPLNIVLRQGGVPRRVVMLLGIVFGLIGLGIVGWLTRGTAWQAPALLSGLAAMLIAAFQTSALRSRSLQASEWVRGRVESSRIGPSVRWIGHKIQRMSEFSLVRERYRSVVTKIVAYRRWRMGVVAGVVGLLLLSGVFVATGLLKNEFFPAVDAERLYVNVEGPVGWTKPETEAVLNELEPIVWETPEVTTIQTTLGSQANMGFGPGGGAGNHTASMTLLLPPVGERERTSMDISKELRQRLSSYQKAKVTVMEESGGPPAGASFQANIQGEDLQQLEKIANDFQKVLKDIPGAINISSSLTPAVGQVTVVLKEPELARRGLTAAQVGSWLRTALSGTEATSFVTNDVETNIMVKLADPYQQLDVLPQLQLPTPTGTYALSEIADIRLENSPTVIERQDGKRVVRVTAGGEGIAAPELLQAFQEKVKSLEIPAGYTWDVGGANEENQESVNSIIQAMGVSFFLIVVTLVLQLGSFRKAILVTVVIPLALIGVVINFTIFQIPLSFPALIGVLSLFGIVVNNALMVVEKINLNLEHDFEVDEAVVDGATSRLEAIFLSSLASIVGLLPVTISDPLWRGLGGAIIAGMTVSGLLILFLLPALYIEVFGAKRKAA